MQFRDIIEKANTLAERKLTSETYQALRELPLADYCALQLNVPQKYSALKDFIPKMPSADQQKRWVGDSGPQLMRRSASLVRLYEYLSWRQTGSGLFRKNILDYGCGWGRILRLLPYFVNHEQIEGVDPMPESLKICQDSGIHSKVYPVSARPEPFESALYSRFDVVTLFSVFTHTPDWLIVDVLKNCDKATNRDGRVFCTIRSDDWLIVREGVWPKDLLDRVKTEYANSGYSFIGIGGSSSGLDDQLYGDTITTVDYFKSLCERAGWRIDFCDRDPLEPFQLCVVLSKA